MDMLSTYQRKVGRDKSKKISNIEQRIISVSHSKCKKMQIMKVCENLAYTNIYINDDQKVQIENV